MFTGHSAVVGNTVVTINLTFSLGYSGFLTWVAFPIKLKLAQVSPQSTLECCESSPSKLVNSTGYRESALKFLEYPNAVA